MHDALNRPLALADATIDLRASIGVAWAQIDTTAEALIAHADAAMYESKRNHRHKSTLFVDAAAPSAHDH